MDTLVALLSIAHLLATTMMTGLILFVSVVHYPLMAAVGERGYQQYQSLHVQRTTWVVMPLMLVEAGCAAFFIVVAPSLLSVTGLLLVAAVWASTFFLSVPAHQRLGDGFDAQTHRRLVWTNHIRAAGWIARVPVVVWMTGQTVIQTWST